MELGNYSAIEYYLEKFGIDLEEYDRKKASLIGSFFLDNILCDTQEELLNFLGEKIEKKESLED